MTSAADQIKAVVADVLGRVATDSGKDLDGGELVLVEVEQAATAVAAALLPKLQATVDYHAAQHHTAGD